jgi:hypothetical protein
MSTNIEQKSQLAERHETFLERLADKVGSNVRASVVFGERVERDGVTIIPVARAWWGFGGGSGANSQAGGPGWWSRHFCFTSWLYRGEGGEGTLPANL